MLYVFLPNSNVVQQAYEDVLGKVWFDPMKSFRSWLHIRRQFPYHASIGHLIWFFDNVL